MSVACFGPHELSNLCAACASKTGRPVQSFFPAAARYSQDNTACFAYQYKEDEDAEPVEAEELQATLPSKVDFERARLTARLLRYNLVANNGRDFADAESLAACAELCEAVGEKEKAAAIRSELAPSACCRDPEVRGGRCSNCGTYVSDEAGLPQGDNEG